MTTTAEVRGLGPIFTTTAAVATDRVDYTFDVANNNNTSAAWYLESYITGFAVGNRAVFVGSGASITDWRAGYIGYRASDQSFALTYNDASQIVFTALKFSEDAAEKAALVYNATDSKLDVNLNNVWSGGEKVDFTFMHGTGPLRSFSGDGASGYLTTARLREIQRYDITSFQNGKDIIDGLMP